MGLAAIVVAFAAIGATSSTAWASGSPLGPPAAPTTAPFQQCAAVYLDPSCGYLIDITSASSSRVFVDPSISFYEGSDDVLVGVQNDSSAPVSSIHVGVPGSGYGSFGFDGDGLCTPGGGPVPADCPFGPVGDPGDYFGPDAQLTADTGTLDSGTVSFPVPLAPGQYTYFSLEAPFAGAAVLTGTQNDVVSTSLSDGTNSGVHLAEPAPVNVTDTASILGANSSSATGSVTYTVYSDPACTVQVASGGTKTVSFGTAGPSDAFGAALPTNATYYVQATYTGDGGAPTHNDAATTNCGDETVTFGTPPVKPQAVIATSLVASSGATGGQLTVVTGTAVHDTTSVTFNRTPQSGRVTYYVYSDSACTRQVPGVNLGSGAAVNGAYPPSATVTLPAGVYYFQAIYSGNQFLAGARSACAAEVLTVAPPCACAKIFSYLNAFHTFGAGSTRLEFNIHSAISCTVGAGGCAGTLTLKAPGHAKFIDSRKAKNGAVGLKLTKSTATLAFRCAGPCAATTVQQPFTLQWVAFKRVKIHRKHKKAIFKTVPDPKFLPAGRAGTTITVTAVQVCNGVTTTKKLKIRFDEHGQIYYKKSDLNGDGFSDGRQLKDSTGFV